MYELLTGSVPFKGDNAVEIALKQMKERIPSIRKQNPLIPQSVENIVLKATAKNPKNRYDSIKDMHDDLVHALDPERQNETRYKYPYPESEMDDPKKYLLKSRRRNISNQKWNWKTKIEWKYFKQRKQEIKYYNFGSLNSVFNLNWSNILF